MCVRAVDELVPDAPIAGRVLTQYGDVSAVLLDGTLTLPEGFDLKPLARLDIDSLAEHFGSLDFDGETGQPDAAIRAEQPGQSAADRIAPLHGRGIRQQLDSPLVIELRYGIPIPGERTLHIGLGDRRDLLPYLNPERFRRHSPKRRLLLAPTVLGFGRPQESSSASSFSLEGFAAPAAPVCRRGGRPAGLLVRGGRQP